MGHPLLKAALVRLQEGWGALSLRPFGKQSLFERNTSEILCYEVTDQNETAFEGWPSIQQPPPKKPIETYHDVYVYPLHDGFGTGRASRHGGQNCWHSKGGLL